jgi:hypothetical protein
VRSGQQLCGFSHDPTIPPTAGLGCALRMAWTPPFPVCLSPTSNCIGRVANGDLALARIRYNLAIFLLMLRTRRPLT